MSHAPLTTTSQTTTPQVCTLDCTDTIMKVKGSIPRYGVDHLVFYSSQAVCLNIEELVGTTELCRRAGED